MISSLGVHAPLTDYRKICIILPVAAFVEVLRMSGSMKLFGLARGRLDFEAPVGYYGEGPIVMVSYHEKREKLVVRTGSGIWDLDKVAKWLGGQNYVLLGYIDKTQPIDVQTENALAFCRAVISRRRKPMVMSPNWDMLKRANILSEAPGAYVVFFGGGLGPYTALTRAADVEATCLAQYAYELSGAQMQEMRAGTIDSGLAWYLHIGQRKNHRRDGVSRLKQILALKPDAFFCNRVACIENRMQILAGT
ncbi:MAG: hypothetical protein MUD10_01330 [Candidatus Pacebacteria bacterium]|nr:hypothetical protein [Candidatus Paceibacterota bacterium]